MQLFIKGEKERGNSVRYTLYVYISIFWLFTYLPFSMVIFNLKLHYATPILLNPELRWCCISELCTIVRIYCKRMGVSFSPAASRQILKTTDSETEEAVGKKHRQKKRAFLWRVKTFRCNKSCRIVSPSKHANKRKSENPSVIACKLSSYRYVRLGLCFRFMNSTLVILHS